MKKTLIIILTFCIVHIVFGQDTNMPELDSKDVHVIQLQEEGDTGFRSGYVECTLEGGSLRLKVEGLAILQKVQINIIAADPDQPIDIYLLKENWDDVVDQKMNVTKLFDKTFHTYHNFGISVNSKYADAKFYVAVFVSPELKPSLEHLFYPANEYTDGESASPVTGADQAALPPSVIPNSNNNSMIMYVIAFLLFVIILLLMIFLFRNKKGAVATSVILFITVGNLDAGVKSSNAEAWQGLRKVLQVSDMTDMKVFMNMIGKLNERAFKIESILENLLSESNSMHVPSIDPRGLPSLPSSCYEVAKKVMNQSGDMVESNESKACNCLESAYEDFYENYMLFEKLRIIKDDITKTTDASIAFGDNVSGVHAISGLAWQSARRGIVASMVTFNNTYDKKVLEFLDRLHKNLNEIDKCEHELGFAGWYRRVGFMYYQFTKVRYER